jgi:S1-C subfamily serine protease
MGLSGQSPGRHGEVASVQCRTVPVRLIRSHRTVTLQIFRNGETIEVPVKLGQPEQ